MRIFAFLSLMALIGIFSCSGETPTERGSYNDLTVKEFQQIQPDFEGIILDVRTPGEVSAGVIPGAIVLNIAEQQAFMEGISKLDKNKAVVAYCKVGGRSAKASKILVQQGFTDVSNLLGGFDKWKASGGEIATAR
jgi:rhodanese-related sulfurtransferase